MLFTVHKHHTRITVLICIVYTMSMLIYIQPWSRIHVMVTQTSNATLYLSEWPGHTTPSHIISYTNLPESICCEYSKEPSRCDCSLEHPEHTHTLLSYQKAAPRTIIILLFKTMPPLDNPPHFTMQNLHLLWPCHATDAQGGPFK